MLGAIVGDIIGSPYEFCNTKSPAFDLFMPQSRDKDNKVKEIFHKSKLAPS